jgi:anti-sigma regulatory factor (Ser/Thr protein kinase)
MAQPTVTLLHYTLSSRLDQIDGLVHAVQNALIDFPQLVFGVNLCLDELITNTITHGLSQASHGKIEVQITTSDQYLKIIVKDNAPPFNPFSNATKPDVTSSLEERPIGGLGIHLVKQLVIRHEYQYQDKSNVTSLFIALPSQ